MSKPQVLVLCGDGINCEKETARAFEMAGAKASICHINDALTQKKQLQNFQILALPGGFSFGDEISSGQILGLKMKHGMGEELKEFVQKEKLIIGICNGFQAMVKLGLLPYPLQERVLTLTNNEPRTFIDRWVDLIVPENSNCLWTKKLKGKKITFPIRHGEGRIAFASEEKAQTYFQRLKLAGQIALTYTEDINGSYENIAGLSDPTGKIFGLMPHPEAATSNLLCPSPLQEALGLEIFKSAVDFFKEN
ncbi:MAG: phosphoribosylformylglycinamidine synthase subunit PurQ [Bacteriovoracaceae bacterium]|nr:phosphoribosylformylglycinamidine synthase subunit PurQ [Bacteriovoracaceae bacterium]